MAGRVEPGENGADFIGATATHGIGNAALDGFVEQVGPTGQLPEMADEVLDLPNHVVLPGLINTHHHFYQTLTRVVPAAQNANLFTWLKTLYPIWAGLTPEDIYISTQTALAELALSGCTTASDHLYIFPNGSRLDDEIHAAREIGLRLHASRGSMSLGESKGGLPPDRVVEDEAAIEGVSAVPDGRDEEKRLRLAGAGAFGSAGQEMRQQQVGPAGHQPAARDGRDGHVLE